MKVLVRGESWCEPAASEPSEDQSGWAGSCGLQGCNIQVSLIALRCCQTPAKEANKPPWLRGNCVQALLFAEGSEESQVVAPPQVGS